MTASAIPRCHHVMLNGKQCGSAALRGQHFCYFHDGLRRRLAAAPGPIPGRPHLGLDLPPLEDGASVQVALMDVMRALIDDRIDSRKAALLLYGLQTASGNLKRANFDPCNPVTTPPEEIEAAIAAPFDPESDDEADDESDDEVGDETDPESDAPPASHPEPAADPEPAAHPEPADSATTADPEPASLRAPPGATEGSPAF